MAKWVASSDTTQDCFQTLTPISPQPAQIVTGATRGPEESGASAGESCRSRHRSSASAAPRSALPRLSGSGLFRARSSPGSSSPGSAAPRRSRRPLERGRRTAAARRRRAWCPTAHEPSTINHYHGCHRRRLRSSSPRPRSDLVPRLSSLQQRRGPRQGVQRRRARGRGAASYRAVAPAHRAGPLHPEAACGSLPVSPCDPLG